MTMEFETFSDSPPHLKTWWFIRYEISVCSTESIGVSDFISLWQSITCDICDPGPRRYCGIAMLFWIFCEINDGRCSYYSGFTSGLFFLYLLKMSSYHPLNYNFWIFENSSTTIWNIEIWSNQILPIFDCFSSFCHKKQAKTSKTCFLQISSCDW